jgi:hypothetical protein
MKHRCLECNASLLDALAEILKPPSFRSKWESAQERKVVGTLCSFPSNALSGIAGSGPPGTTRLLDYTVISDPVLEPSTLALASAGALLSFGHWWRRRQRLRHLSRSGR